MTAARSNTTDLWPLIAIALTMFAAVLFAISRTTAEPSRCPCQPHPQVCQHCHVPTPPPIPPRFPKGDIEPTGSLDAEAPY